MAQLYAVEPWRLVLIGAYAGFAYALTPHLLQRGGHLMPLVVLIFTVDQLAGHCTRKPVFGQLGLAVGATALVGFELAVLRPGVDPRLLALFAVGIGLLQLLVFGRVARCLRRPVDSRLKRAAFSGSTALSILVPPAAILTTGLPQLVLQFAWTVSGVLVCFLILKALDRPVPAAASIETP